MSDPAVPDAASSFGALAADARAERLAARHALEVLEYALTAPAPRRHRTWLHRVTVAVDALHDALLAQRRPDEHPLGLLDEIALANPSSLVPIQQLQQELLDLTIAVVSLREQIEPDPVIDVDPDDVRDRLAELAGRFRHHQMREAEVVRAATGIELDDAALGSNVSPPPAG